MRRRHGHRCIKSRCMAELLVQPSHVSFRKELSLRSNILTKHAVSNRHYHYYYERSVSSQSCRNCSHLILCMRATLEPIYVYVRWMMLPGESVSYATLFSLPVTNAFVTFQLSTNFIGEELNNFIYNCKIKNLKCNWHRKQKTTQLSAAKL